MNKKSKLFLVLCLHRSGSSATAGTLSQIGIHMGDNLIGAIKGNSKGHFENKDFVKLNNKLLNDAGGSWKNPQNLKFTLPVENEGLFKNFIAEHEQPVWGLKDPRMLLTFKLWKPYFEKRADITYIFVHRSFESSIKSLAFRNNISEKNAREILLPYLLQLHYYRFNFGLNKNDIIDINFEELVEDPKPFVAKVNQRIGQKPYSNLDKVEAFLDHKLKSF